MREKTGWALKYKFDWGYSLLGIYCWQDNRNLKLKNNKLQQKPFKLKLFNTRREAREAKKTCCYPTATPVKVKIIPC